LQALHDFINWTPLGLPAFLFVITVVVFFHELGHFLVARACGVKVDIFSIGFGKEIFGFNDRLGTRWRLSWIPVGGYVKFAGDANAASLPDAKAAEAMPASEREHVMFFKPLWQRAAIAAAGPFANFIIAIILLTGLLVYSGKYTLPPVVGSVIAGSAAEAAGIKPGDRIVSVNGTQVDDYFQLPQIISVRGGEDLTIGLERQGAALTLHAVPRLVRLRNGFGQMETTYVIGVGPSRQVKPVFRPYSLPSAFAAACVETKDIIQGTLLGVVKLAQGHASKDQVRGTVGMMDITQKVAQQGFLSLLNLVAVLSVSIGLVNLFPIPVLDGGHLLYYACEAVLGRPLGARAQDVGFRLGLVLVLGLMLLTTWNDLVRLNLF
jgi:regulator of sigma E protease